MCRDCRCRCGLRHSHILSLSLSLSISVASLESGCCLCLTFTASGAAFSDLNSEFRPIIAASGAAHKLAALVAVVNTDAAAINYIRCCVGMDRRKEERRDGHASRFEVIVVVVVVVVVVVGLKLMSVVAQSFVLPLC